MQGFLWCNRRRQDAFYKDKIIYHILIQFHVRYNHCLLMVMLNMSFGASAHARGLQLISFHDISSRTLPANDIIMSFQRWVEFSGTPNLNRKGVEEYPRLRTRGEWPTLLRPTIPLHIPQLLVIIATRHYYRTNST